MLFWVSQQVDIYSLHHFDVKIYYAVVVSFWLLGQIIYTISPLYSPQKHIKQFSNYKKHRKFDFFLSLPVCIHVLTLRKKKFKFSFLRVYICTGYLDHLLVKYNFRLNIACSFIFFHVWVSSILITIFTKKIHQLKRIMYVECFHHFRPLFFKCKDNN